MTADKAAEFGVQWQDLSGARAARDNSAQAFGGTNFGSPGQNILGIAANPAQRGPRPQRRRDQGPRSTIPGIGEILNLGVLVRALETRQQRQHPVHADAADARQRGSEDHHRPERAVHHRPVRADGRGDHADAVPDHRARATSASRCGSSRRSPRAAPCGCRSTRKSRASQDTHQPRRRDHQQARGRIDGAGGRRADRRDRRADPGRRSGTASRRCRCSATFRCSARCSRTRRARAARPT